MLSILSRSLVAVIQDSQARSWRNSTATILMGSRRNRSLCRTYLALRAKSLLLSSGSQSLFLSHAPKTIVRALMMLIHYPSSRTKYQSEGVLLLGDPHRRYWAPLVNQISHESWTNLTVRTTWNFSIPRSEKNEQASGVTHYVAQTACT